MVDNSRDVFLLEHVNPDNDDDAKTIGIYSTREKAKTAMLSLQKQPGFKEHPEGFEICPYRLDLTSWTEGFITIKHKPASKSKSKERPSRANARGHTRKVKEHKD
jgi:hypothetical protein